MSHKLGDLLHHHNHKGVDHMSGKPSIVFCHGIWADGSCFSKLLSPLRADGHEVICAQYNLDTAQSDIDAVIRTLGRVSSPSILVGHSYGGAVITGAGIDDRVVGLVYISAVAPDEDETAAEQQAKYPTTELFGEIEVADGRIWMLPSGIGYFCGDLTEDEQQVVWSTATPPAVEPFTQIWSAPRPSAWAPRPTRSTAATCRCCRNPMSCSPQSATSRQPSKDPWRRREGPGVRLLLDDGLRWRPDGVTPTVM